MTASMKHFAMQCAKAWSRMDGDQMIFIAILTALRSQERHLRNQLESYHRNMEGKKLYGAANLDHAEYITATSSRADTCQLLAEKIEAWFQEENVEHGPFSHSDWQLLARVSEFLSV